MAALDFPSTIRGQNTGTTYTGGNGVAYIWDGYKWVGHSPTLAPGSNSISNNGNVVQVDANGNLVIPDGTTILYAGGGSPITGGGNTSTSWTAVPVESGCPIYAELTPAHFYAYTQKSHLRLENTGNWDIGSDFHNTGIGSYDGSTLAINALIGSISVNAGNDNSWTFGTDGNLTFPDATKQTTAYTGILDGGRADDSVGITFVSYDDTDFSGTGNVYITYNIADAGAKLAGVIINGITVDHSQTTIGTHVQGINTLTVSAYYFANQMVDIIAFVESSSGYTYYSDPELWDVPAGPCLVEGTQITMADGTHKSIEDIQHGDLIRVWNFDLGEFSEAQPIWIKCAEEINAYDRFTFSDGTVLNTVGHFIFNKQAGKFTKFIEDDNTPVGTTTFNEHGAEVTLLSKERIFEPTRYYHVWTQYHLNLFSNGILTSHRFNNIYPIVDMKFVKDDRTLRDVSEFAGIDEKYITGVRLQEQPLKYSTEYIKDYINRRVDRTDISNIVEQGI